MTYLTFNYLRASSSGKTKVWSVENQASHILGSIHWFSKWRKYIFEPTATTYYDPVCLREIADFLEKQTKEHYGKDPRQIEMIDNG